MRTILNKSQEEIVVSDTDDLLGLLVDDTDATPHGKCNAVYVGFSPSAAQATALTTYSAQYKARFLEDTGCSWHYS